MSKKIYALLVGIDDYQSPVQSLQGCVNDIQAIAEYLQGRVDSDRYSLHLRTLTNQDATRKNIIEGWEQHLSLANSEDIALFYYSGHGGQEKVPPEFRHLEPDGWNETLVCYNSRQTGNYDLADKELSYLINQVAQNNPRIVVILDCCHAGSGTRNIASGVRLAPQDTRERNIASFVFAEDEKVKSFLLSQDTTTNGETGLNKGLNLDKGRHILLAACHDYQYAQEYVINDPENEGETRGIFSYSLLKTLVENQGNLSYVDLANQVEARIKSKTVDQVPRLEATNSEDLKELFLGDAIPQTSVYFSLNYRDRQKSWQINRGAIHGIPKLASLAIFPVEIDPDHLKQIAYAIAEGEITQVRSDSSQVEIGQELSKLDKNQSYWAVITSLPIQPLKVYFTGETNKIDLVTQAIASSNIAQKSLFFQQTDNSSTADLTLQATEEEYWIKQQETPLIAPFKEAQRAIAAIEAIARWRNTLELKSPQSSIKAQDVTMEITLVGYEGEDGEITPVNHTSDSSDLRFEYQYQHGEWKRPVGKIKLTNHSNYQLFCSVLSLANDYSIEPRIHYYPNLQSPEPYEEATILLPGINSTASNVFESLVFFDLPEEQAQQGITEVEDIFKLIVSKTDFNADLLQQDGFEPPPVKRSTLSPLGTLDCLMQQITTRGMTKSRKKVDDWLAKEMSVTLVKPRNTRSLQANRSVKLLNNLVEIQPHPSLQAQVTLSTVAHTTRKTGTLTSPALRDEPGIIESWQFTNSRSSDPGLSVLELLEVQNFQTVTKQQPLTLTIDRPIADNEYLLPISYDGEFLLPLGYGVPQGKQTKVALERLPQPTSSNRSLTGSIKIFFKKLRYQKLGHSYQYPLLAIADIQKKDQELEVSYQPDLATVKQKVASAQKIVLYLHGIIGDTKSMVTSVQKATVKINGQQRPLKDAYDLVLAFDYENLHTTIEENAQLLKERLKAVGLGANHGKQLHIVAHSMGGLISRWFIEREGGHQVVQHLIMLGTPNAGSPWSTVQDMSFAMLGMGLNQISGVVLPAKIVTDLVSKSLNLIEQIDNSLDQMQPDSDFIKAIALNPDPHIPYTIIAGNRALPTIQEQNRLRRLMNKLFAPAINKVLDGLIFGGEPHDIAVSLTSIKSVNQKRSPQPKILPDVACDHMNYFTSEPGLKALVEALY